jgi:hypothetical protein
VQDNKDVFLRQGSTPAISDRAFFLVRKPGEYEFPVGTKQACAAQKQAQPLTHPEKKKCGCK